ncbi:hypothetical protein F5X68DRAFT_264782 [Plectosphaerella plurivora]|uniref:Uncharacterized protein n=1 Tax=Plectosphaerella plurivora TaxID=936078 RepID=A0A9P8V3E0_9PEZI|nr:hypothetical protein F5X68DRAFT_264782 [Plectosphaerella plurivora]
MLKLSLQKEAYDPVLHPPSLRHHEVSVSAVIVAALGFSSTASAAFIAFPDQQTCATSATGSSTLTRQQLENAVVNGARTLVDPIARNTVVGPACLRLRDPLYNTWVRGFGNIYFVFKGGDYTYCHSLGFDPAGSGYPAMC